MIRINLLAEKKAVRARARGPLFKFEGINTQGFLIAGFVGMALLYVGWQWRALSSEGRRLDKEISVAQQEELRLRAVNARVEELKNKRTLLQDKVTLITQLKNNQAGPVHMLDQVSRNLPDFLWLDSLNESSTILSINGKATTYNAVSNFYNNLTQSPFFTDVVLGTTLEIKEGVSFSLNCKFVPPAARAAAAGDKAAAEGT